jgi:hypothetical protein
MLVATLAGCAVLAGRPSSSQALGLPSAIPTPPITLTPFQAITRGGATLTIHDTAGCAQLNDAWLEAWCVDLVGFAPEALPQSMSDLPPLHGAAGEAFIQLMDAAFAWALLHTDQSICDQPVVSAYAAAGFHAPSGPDACRAAFARSVSDGYLPIDSPARVDSLTRPVSIKVLLTPIPSSS